MVDRSSSFSGKMAANSIETIDGVTETKESLCLWVNTELSDLPISLRRWWVKEGESTLASLCKGTQGYSTCFWIKLSFILKWPKCWCVQKRSFHICISFFISQYCCPELMSSSSARLFPCALWKDITVNSSFLSVWLSLGFVLACPKMPRSAPVASMYSWRFGQNIRLMQYLFSLLVAAY